jgi:hypothetical protein
MSHCPSCGQDEGVPVEVSCLDEEGEPMVFMVCRNCDYGINEHTEGVCDCAPRCEATVIKGGESAFCDRPLDERGYCGHERSHVDARD